MSATEKQINYLKSLIDNSAHKSDESEHAGAAKALFDAIKENANQLTKEQASFLIGALQDANTIYSPNQDVSVLFIAAQQFISAAKRDATLNELLQSFL